MSNNKRDGNIELLRFIFANWIVLHHALLPRFRGGWLGVEFFFLLTGYYMAKNLEKDCEAHSNEPYRDTAAAGIRYIWNKFRKLFPYIFWSTILGFIVQALDLSYGGSAKEIVKQAAKLPYDLLPLQNFGYASLSCTGTLWYLSAMFFAIWLLYPIVRRRYHFYTGYLAPGIAIFLSGYLVRTYGMLGSANDFSGVNINSGFVRAIAEISLGMFLYVISRIFEQKAMSRRESILFTIIEILSLVLLFLYMYFWKPETGYLDSIAVMLMFIGITILMSGHSLLSGLFDNNLSRILGKISMVLFMNHAYWLFHIVSLCGKAGIEKPETDLKLIGILLSYCTTGLVFALVKIFRKKDGIM